MKKTLLWAYAIVITLLLLMDVGWRAWTRSGDKEGLHKLFRVVAVHTNDVEGPVDGIAIVDAKTKQPVMTKLSSGSNVQPEMINYFFQGKNVMDLALMTNGPARRGVTFYDTNGNIKVWWVDRGGRGLFTDRIFYGEGKPRLEFCYNDTWYPAVEQDGKRGIVLDGQWRRLKLTNGVWIILPPDNSSTTKQSE
jgi:hypothetical protein